MLACHGTDASGGGGWSGVIEDKPIGPPLSFVVGEGYGYVVRMMAMRAMCGRHKSSWGK